MKYQMVTIEKPDDDALAVEVHYRDKSDSLAWLVRRAHLMGWIPGSVSGTGLTITEVNFVSLR